MAENLEVGNERVKLKFIKKAYCYGIELYLKNKDWILIARDEKFPLFIIYNSPLRYKGEGIRKIKVEENGVLVWTG